MIRTLKVTCSYFYEGIVDGVWDNVLSIMQLFHISKANGKWQIVQTLDWRVHAYDGGTNTFAIACMDKKCAIVV